MGINIFAAIHGLRYFLFSKHRYGHGIHSPFVYTLIREVFLNKKQYPEYQIIESHRKRLLQDKTQIAIQDFGAGSYTNNAESRQVSTIAKSGISSKKYAQLLFRLVQYTQAQHILELGTSLGISGAYLSIAHPKTRLVTLEGSHELSAIAKKTFTGCSIHNIEILCGNFNETLEIAIDTLQTIDIAFIDGNHQKQATLDYFEKIFPHCNQDSILIFDDIYWSKGMLEAWEIIKKDSRVSLSIDIWKFGIVFFRTGIVKQDFRIRF